MQTLIKRLLPFLMIGLILMIVVFGFILFAYLFLIGAAIGATLFVVQWLKNKWQGKPPIAKQQQKRTTRIIDIDDWKRH